MSQGPQTYAGQALDPEGRHVSNKILMLWSYDSWLPISNYNSLLIIILIKKLQGLMALAKPLQIIWPTGSLLMQLAKQGHCHASHTSINSLALVAFSESYCTSFVIVNDKIHCLIMSTNTHMQMLNEVPLVSVSSCDTVDNAGKLQIGKGAWLNLI